MSQQSDLPSDNPSAVQGECDPAAVFAPVERAPVARLSWNRIQQTPVPEQGCVTTIGTFDGVHKGHQQLLAGAAAHAAQWGVPAVAVTFDPHPLSVISPDRAPLMLTPIEQRCQLLGWYGMDAVLVVPFTQGLMSWTPEHFVRTVLVEMLSARAVWVGEDFRFGARAVGTVKDLALWGEQLGFSVHPQTLVTDPVTAQRCSASAVRQLVARGDMPGAAQVLGRTFAVTGPVVYGDRRGRSLGYPTANVALEPGQQLPADGVYAGSLAVVDDVIGTGLVPYDWVPAAISVGTNPTFDGVARRVEAYVLDRDDLELYDQPVSVRFAQQLRPMVRFAGLDDLIAQMNQDVADTRKVLTL